MKPIKWIFLVAFLGLIFGQMASALESAQYCVVFENRSTDWGEAKLVPQFDPALGTLSRVIVTASASACKSLEIDAVGFWTCHSRVILETTTSTGGQFVLVPLDYWWEEFGPYSDSICGIDDDEFIYDDPADLAAWIGPGKVEFKAAANSEFAITGSGPIGTSVASFADETICVVYQYTPSLCINGSKINDCNGANIEGWEICLAKPDGETICTTTDANGDYSFCGMVPGGYKVCEEDRDAWTHTDEPCRDVTLIEDSEEDVDFHNQPLLCISGRKYNSKTDAGVSGWLITLKDDSGAVLDQKQTGKGGNYEFCGLESGDYTVCEEMKSGWKKMGPECIDVALECANSLDNDFENEPLPNPPCRNGRPWFIKNELYTASCQGVKEVDAGKGILANDPAGSIVTNPESITIDPKYGSIEVHEDGSFVYDPTGATGLYSGVYLIFKYNANNGRCDARYPGIAKIQIRC